ncbi:hypothetical protein ACFFRR_011791 [Megaselia abdita]
MSFRLAIVLLSVVATKVVYSSVCLKSPVIGQWVSGENGFVPPGSVLGGYQGSEKVDLYICRAGGIVGKYYNPNKMCYVQENKKIQSHKHYEILTEVGHTVWVPVAEKQMPCNLVQTGGTSHAPTFAGRVTVEDDMIPGNVIDGEVYIPWTNGNSYTTFEALSAVPKTINLPAGRQSFVFGTSEKYLTFKVKSREEVYIDFGSNVEMKYRLTIGAFRNRVSGFGPLSDSLKVYEKTAEILSPTELNGFWVRWISGNTLEFGSEGVLKPLVVFSDAQLHLVNSVLFSSSSSKDSSWQIANLVEWDGAKFIERK